MAYLWVKWLHVMSSTLLFGTGLGIAFFFWKAHRGGDARVIAATARTVVIADTCFTAPAVVVQFATGVWLAQRMGITWDTFWHSALWLKWALVLFFLVGACWLPVLWLQVHAQRLARQAAARGEPLPAGYHRTMRWWAALGWPAFTGVAVIFWLMVVKPVG